MPIDPNRLMELRKRKKWSRAQLAHESNITQRQITRLESKDAAASMSRDRTVNELARALGVEAGVLTGEMPMPAAAWADLHRKAGLPRQVSAWVQPETSLACTLIRRRYGINLTTLVNAAPLMFVLLAESSFVWRREKLKEVEDAMKALEDLASSYRHFPAGMAGIEDGAQRERQSIEKRDLFGEYVADRWNAGVPEYGLGHDPNDCNPFADYLRDLAGKVGNPDIIDVHKGEDTIHDGGPLKGFPRSSIYDEDLDKLACGCRRLVLALRLGLRIGHMPEQLLASDAADERREWLEQQIEEQCSPELKKLLDFRIDLQAADEERTAP